MSRLSGTCKVCDAGGVIPPASGIVAVGPYGATTVQEALDLLRVMLGDEWQVVSTLADLDVFAPAVAGERLIDQSVLIVTALDLLAGEHILFGPNGVIAGLSAASCRIHGDVDGALIRGSVVCVELDFDNANAGPSAQVFDISSGGRAVRVEYCSIGPGSPVGRIHDAFGVVAIDRVLIGGAPVGWKFSGVLAAVQLINCGSQGMPAGAVVFDVEASANVIVGFEISGCTFITADPTDRGIRIDAAATIPGGALPSAVVGVNILGCTITGPGQLIDTAPGSLPLSSSKLIVNGCPSTPDSRFLAVSDFEDFVTPIVTTYAGLAPTAWIPVAHRNAGASSVLTQLAVTARHTLLKNAGDDFDWSFRADGPTPQTVAVQWSVTLEANAGPGDFIEYAVEKQTAAVGPAWVLVEGSNRRVEQRATSGNVSGTAWTSEAPGDLFRLVGRNTTGTNATDVQHLDFAVSRA